MKWKKIALSLLLFLFLLTAGMGFHVRSKKNKKDRNQIIQMFNALKQK